MEEEDEQVVTPRGRGLLDAIEGSAVTYPLVTEHDIQDMLSDLTNATTTTASYSGTVNTDTDFMNTIWDNSTTTDRSFEWYTAPRIEEEDAQWLRYQEEKILYGTSGNRLVLEEEEVDEIDDYYKWELDEKGSKG